MRRIIPLLLCHTLYSITLHCTRPIVSLHSYSLGASEAIIGVLVSTFALLPMILAIKVGKWLDAYGAQRLISIGGLGIFFSISGTCLVNPNLFALLFSQLFIGLSHLLILVSLQKTIGNLGNHCSL